jgi:hypothetical protein
MLGAYSLASRPLGAGPAVPRPFLVEAVSGEYGYAAWSYSRQAKLNAWSWHGVGALMNVMAWASLGNAVYMRSETDNYIYIQQPDTFYASGDTNYESSSVEATSQWLDMGKPGKRKALTGIDFDGQNITTVEIYVSEGGDRVGELAESVAIGSNQGGWTYSGELIPLSTDGTEFKLRFIAAANTEAQVNKVTLHWDDIAG